MGCVRQLTILAFTVSAWLGAATAADAASITFYDDYRGAGVVEDSSVSRVIWTLNADDNCTTCSILLSASFTGDANYYVGAYLDAVQWVISDPDVTPTSAGFDGFYVNGMLDQLWGSHWSFALHQNVNANQCNDHSNAADAVCGEWIGGGAAGGFGAIANDMLLQWTFDTTFSSELTQALRGNIRTAYNDSRGRNYNIFGAGGGAFVEGGCSDIAGCQTLLLEQSELVPQPVPEPATLMIFGSGLIGVAAAVKRRSRRQHRGAER